MKVTAKVSIVLALLSVASGTAYLFVGLTQSHDRNLGFTHWSGVAQILISLFLLVTAIYFIKRSSQCVASLSIYTALLAYTLVGTNTI